MTILFIQTCPPWRLRLGFDTGVIALTGETTGYALLGSCISSPGGLTGTDPLSAGKFEAGLRVEYRCRMCMLVHVPSTWV